MLIGAIYHINNVTRNLVKLFSQNVTICYLPEIRNLLIQRKFDA